MNLIVDIGNTLVKLALMQDGQIVAQRAVERLLPAMIEELIEDHRVARAILASTRGEIDAYEAMIRRYVPCTVVFTAQTPVPIANAYLTPESLGRDRLAAAVGAATLYPRRNVLIVDFGTAVTLDLVTADNTYRGGVISPGLNTRFRALHDYTAQLPLCVPSDDVGLQGLTTEQAILRGVMNSLTFEIEGYISRMRPEFDDLCVIFTGGDAKYFVKRIKNTIFANCNLVFCGLERILEHNASEEHLN